MGLFDFFKKNKDILTDNGTNLLYKNGKLKEKFNKLNGILNGEYYKLDESGKILSLELYHNGQIISENSQKEKALNEYHNKITKLIEIDKIISDVASWYLIIQMTNDTLLDFSGKLSILFINYFEEKYLEIYLFHKRNYIINKLICYEIDKINANKIFTNYLEKENKRKSIGGDTVYFSKAVLSNHIKIIEKVISRLKKTNNYYDLITELSLDSFNVIDKSNNITNQDCELIGLKIDGYLSIKNKLKITEDKINEDYMFYQDETHNQKIVDIIYKDISSICKRYKFNQTGIKFNLENLNVQNLIKL